MYSPTVSLHRLILYFGVSAAVFLTIYIGPEKIIHQVLSVMVQYCEFVSAVLHSL
jgi:hypothetical protein